MLPNDLKSLNEVDITKMNDHEIQKIAFNNMWDSSYSHLGKMEREIMNQAHWQGFRFAFLLMKKSIIKKEDE